jgi:hypothetical protein
MDGRETAEADTLTGHFSILCFFCASIPAEASLFLYMSVLPLGHMAS